MGTRSFESKTLSTRQTVIDGPKDSKGKANFLEPGTGLQVRSTDLTSHPLQLTWGDGFSGNGYPVDHTLIRSEPFSFDDLPDNQKSYLYVDLLPGNVLEFGHARPNPIYHVTKAIWDERLFGPIEGGSYDTQNNWFGEHIIVTNNVRLKSFQVDSSMAQIDRTFYLVNYPKGDGSWAINSETTVYTAVTNLQPGPQQVAVNWDLEPGSYLVSTPPPANLRLSSKVWRVEPTFFISYGGNTVRWVDGIAWSDRPFFHFNFEVEPMANQFWYPSNHQSRGEVWDGEQWQPKLRLMLGECETSGGEIQDITSYAYQGRSISILNSRRGIDSYIKHSIGVNQHLIKQSHSMVANHRAQDPGSHITYPLGSSYIDWSSMDIDTQVDTTNRYGRGVAMIISPTMGYFFTNINAGFPTQSSTYMAAGRASDHHIAQYWRTF